MSVVASGQVLVVSADERWLRVLEVTIRLGGVETISRRTAREALIVARGDTSVAAIVLDLAQATSEELDLARGLLSESTIPSVVILPERLAEQREPFAAAGATVLVRPYPPSHLYAALRITEGDGAPPFEAETPTASEPVANTATDPVAEVDEA